MKTGIFISARTDSTRLPNKMLRRLVSGDMVIQHDIYRALDIADETVVCTTWRKMDDDLAEIAHWAGAEVFRGSLDDKLIRWLGAAKKYGIDIIANFDGDDLFCDPELLEFGINQMIEQDLDFVKKPKGMACGSFTYCIRTTALEKVCKLKDTSNTQLIEGWFPDTMFKTADLAVTNPIFYSDEIRLTLDYQEDLDFFNAIMGYGFRYCAYLNNIMAFLFDHPEIVEINSFRQVDFLENQKKLINYRWKKNDN